MDYTLIIPRLSVGSHPKSTADVDALKRTGTITAVLNLQTDEDMSYFNLDWPTLEVHYNSCEIQVRRVPVRDFDDIDLRTRLSICVDALNELMESGHHVYVHCSAGACRSPSVVIAYSHWRLGWDLDHATAHVRRLRPCSPNVEAIKLATQDRLRLLEH